MAFANGSQLQLASVAETTFGTTPTTPAFTILRATRSTLRSNKTTIISDEIRGDRNVPDSILAAFAASGDVEGELSYGTYDDIIAAALQSTWSTNVIKNGTTSTYFSLEEKQQLGAGYAYSRYSGCMVDQLSFTMNAREAIKIRASIKAMKEVTGTAALSGATYTAANTKAIQAAPAGVASISFGSYTIKAKSLSFNIKNNLRDRPSIDSLYTSEFGLGRCEIDGEISVYFQDNTVYDAMIQHTAFAISATIGSVTNEKYTIALPVVKPGDAYKSERAANTDVMMTIPFQAVFDSSSSASISITRAVA